MDGNEMVVGIVPDAFGLFEMVKRRVTSWFGDKRQGAEI